MSILLSHNSHDLYQLKKRSSPLRDSLAMKVQYISKGLFRTTLKLSFQFHHI